ncbi:MAG: hypothetical protein Phog2KO_51180 [Phototrophicaceae bacterium]
MGRIEDFQSRLRKTQGEEEIPEERLQEVVRERSRTSGWRRQDSNQKRRLEVVGDLHEQEVKRARGEESESDGFEVTDSESEGEKGG